MPFALELEKTNLSQVTFALDPAANGLASLLLIAKNREDPGIHPWVAHTRSVMTEEELFRHRLVITGFFYAILPPDSAKSFPAYISDLASIPGEELRDRMLQAYAEIYDKYVPANEKKPVLWEKILASPTHYLEFLKMGFSTNHVEDDIETHAYEYVLHPDKMKKLILDHLEWIWENHLEKEWDRVEPMLEKTIEAYRNLDLGNRSPRETVRFITGQDLADAHWNDLFERSSQIVIVPNAHSGLYVHKIMVGDTLCVFFGARQPEGSSERIPELDRTDIISRLSTLADDTRLQILQMIAEKGEMRAQDIVEATRLSQPSISRYLSQLTAAGYLQERRVNTAKLYSMNRERLEKTLKAVSAFLLDQNK